MAWKIVGGPRYAEASEAEPHLAWFEWDIARGDERRTVLVFVSPDLAGVHEEDVPEESYLAASLHGRSAFDSRLEDEDPPTRYAITSEGVRVLGADS